MWTRSDLKSRAKGILKENYWLSLAAILIVSIVSSIFSGLYATGTREYVNNCALFLQGYMTDAEFIAVSDKMNGVLLRSSLIAIIVSIFIIGPLSVGMVKFFLRAAGGENSLGNIWSGFKTNYKNAVWTLFKRNLFVSLWSLLFIIPGIIKAYQYVMVEYILADNPDISSHDALIQSRDMMRGNKWRFFVLQLSFIGWTILGMFACGVGTLFLAPYIQATYAQFYLTVKPQSVTVNAV